MGINLANVLSGVYLMNYVALTVLWPPVLAPCEARTGG